MRIEILSTGNELLSGSLLDTNFSYLATQLNDLGFDIARHHCVGDNLDELTSILQEIGKRADLAIVTGGLGPTLDDLSAQAAANASGVKLALNSEAFALIETFLHTLKRQMSKANEKQAYFPEKSKILPNSKGTAPGFSCAIEKCRFYFLPGVPSEMSNMFDTQVVPNIKKIFGNNVLGYKTKTLLTFGITEGAVNQFLVDLPELFPEVAIGTRVKFPEIQIKLYVKENKASKNQLNEAVKFILNRIGQWVFSVNDESMESIVGDLLHNAKATLAVAENGTGGAITDLLTSIPKSPGFFCFSETLNYRTSGHKNINKGTVKLMAANVRNKQKTTYGLATGGVMEGTICIGIAGPSQTEVYQLHFPFGDRQHKKEIFAMAALDALRRKLLKLPPLEQKF